MLHWLSFEDDSNQPVVAKQLGRAPGELPQWVWFMWVPQLLAALQRPEAPAIKPILLQLALNFPQALYYSLRVYLLTNRESAQKAMAEYQRAKAKMEEEARK